MKRPWIILLGLTASSVAASEAIVSAPTCLTLQQSLPTLREFQSAAREGSADAAWCVAESTEDVVERRAWMMVAAALGNTNAKWTLASQLAEAARQDRGLVTPSLALMRRAATENPAYLLGYAEQYRMLTSDVDGALAILEKAARLGVKYAAAELAEALSDVPTGGERALTWLLVAVAESPVGTELRGRLLARIATTRAILDGDAIRRAEEESARILADEARRHDG